MFGRIVVKKKLEMKPKTHAVDEADPNDQLGYVRPNAGNFVGNHTTVQQEIQVQTRTCGY